MYICVCVSKIVCVCLCVSGCLHLRMRALESVFFRVRREAGERDRVTRRLSEQEVRRTYALLVSPDAVVVVDDVVPARLHVRDLSGGNTCVGGLGVGSKGGGGAPASTR